MRRFAGWLILLVVPGLGLASPMPDGPAGHALASWLEAFNSSDSEQLKSFISAHAQWMHLDRETEHRDGTGGYDLVSIEGSGKLWVEFRAKTRKTQIPIIGGLVVRPDDPEHVSLLGLYPAEPKAGEIVLDESARSRVVDGAAGLIRQFYVFPDAGKKIAAKLEAQQKRGDYRGIRDGQVFAARLSDDLASISGDRHFGVDYFPREMPRQEPGSHPHPDPQRLAAVNCSFDRADHYPGNVGYLKLDGFEEPEICAATAIAALNFLADSDALIFDLRDNHGGSPRMVALICSYLFDEPTHLDDLYDRGKNATEQLWTLPYVPGRKFVGKPVFVLTAHRTFSAGEEFSFDLKSLGRATLVGESTGGGAHTTSPRWIDPHFFVRVPFGRFMNPVTQADWEGTGVEPDIKVAAADALEEALRRARQH